MKTRVISGFALGIALVSIVIFQDVFPIGINFGMGVLAALCVYEVISVAGYAKHLAVMIPSVGMAMFVQFNGVLYTNEFFIYIVYTFIMFGALLIHHKTITFKELTIIYSMTLLIPLSFMTLVFIWHLENAHGVFLTVMALLTAWVPDTGAFFAGTFLGKRKLCPDISPKKTVEGFIGGILTNILAMVIASLIYSYAFYGGEASINIAIVLLLGIGGSFTALLGDLSFSLIKRSWKVKDFGQTIPGHGGFLDRFDSVIFTVPYVYMIYTFLPFVII